MKTALLKSVDTVSNEAKAQAVLPIAEGLLGAQSVDGELAALVASAFDNSAAAVLNDVDKPAWGVYEKLLGTSFKDGTCCVRLTLGEVPERMDRSMDPREGCAAASSAAWTVREADC